MIDIEKMKAHATEVANDTTVCGNQMEREWAKTVLSLLSELEAREADRQRFEFLTDRYRWAGVHIDFEKDGHYRQHRVTWHQGDGWWHAAGQSVEEAIDAAIALAQRQEGEEK